jgi:hypothetical protein
MRERSCACQFGHQFIRLEDKMADGATPFERANPDARKGERPFAPIYPLFNPFARASRRRIGSERARSWFGKAAIDVVGDTLTLELPTKFIADRIRSDFETDLLACCAALVPHIKFVRMVAAKPAGQRHDGVRVLENSSEPRFP